MSCMEPTGIFDGISIIYTSFIENLISTEHSLPLIPTTNPSPSPTISVFKSCPLLFIYGSIMLMSATSISSLNFGKTQ